MCLLFIVLFCFFCMPILEMFIGLHLEMLSCVKHILVQMAHNLGILYDSNLTPGLLKSYINQR